MNDKEIRTILISYILADNSEVRIYQEKAIGNSFCDVMAVSEKLTGFEIKSDIDNYSRLEKQIQSYNKYFDQNYIVVGEKHKNSAADKVPAFWGIICISLQQVEIIRKACKNPEVSRSSQLSILWKAELRSLLVKNNMPMYVQQNKRYIADKILKFVDEKILIKQIADELRYRDYSCYGNYETDSDDELGIKVTNVSPVAELIEKIAEIEIEKLTLDKWIDMFNQAKELGDKRNADSCKLINDNPQNTNTHKIRYTDIQVAMGAPWISDDIINDFIIELLELPSFIRIAEYEPVTGTWLITKTRSYDMQSTMTVKYGLKNYTALFIIDATLNLREIKLYDVKGKFDETSTVAALDKQRLITDKFREWIWQDEERIWEVEESYNRMFSEFGIKNYADTKKEFPGMSPNFHLFEFQNEAVQHIINEKNTLLAFDVGSGKTYIMITAAMEMRRTGLSRKNLFVVPNNIVGQWEKIFTDLYPTADLLTIAPGTFKPGVRDKMILNLRDGDYDGIIIAYSCFELIPLSHDYVIGNMENQLELLNNAVGTLGSYCSRNTAILRQKNYIKKLTAEFIKFLDETPVSVSFDDLGINTIFLDEAHNYKNIPIRTHLKNLNGINTKGSLKCLDMLRKIHCVQEQNNGRGAVLATATPLCNSISDAYTMQMYVQYDLLESRGLHIFDNWVRTFAHPEQLCEIDVDTSKFRMIRRFSRFFNLPELSLMFSQSAVFYSMDIIDRLPAFDKYDEIIIQKHDSLSDYMYKLCERTDKIRSKDVERKVDNMLKVSTDGRKAALDLTLVGAKQNYDHTSKLRRCVGEVMKIYRSGSEHTQLIFCDYSTPKTSKFNVYAKLKELLLEEGIPDKEIAFIHSFHSEARKRELFEKVNAGKVRVLIGSTFKLGTGANVQKKLKAIHHLDVPWRPADMTQREGRILRKGNENESVRIFRYISEGSFDAYSWQILETKQRFISQFLSGSSCQRSIADLENTVLSYGEVKALALSLPEMKIIAEKENELRELNILKMRSIETRKNILNEIENINGELETIKVKLSDAQQNKINMELVTAEQWKDTASKYRDIFTTEYLTTGNEISVLGFLLKTPSEQDMKKPVLKVCSGDTEYTVKMGNSPAGNIRRLINFLKSFDKTISEISERQKEFIIRRDDLNKSLSFKENFDASIKKCQKEIDYLKSKLCDVNDEHSNEDSYLSACS